MELTRLRFGLSGGSGARAAHSRIPKPATMPLRASRDAENSQTTDEDAAVRAAALELRRRIEPDPLAKYLLFISFVLLVFLIVWAYKTQTR